MKCVQGLNNLNFCTGHGLDGWLLRQEIFLQTPGQMHSHTVKFEGPIASHFEGHVTKFVTQKALNSIARDKLTCDRRVVLHRVIHAFCTASQLTRRGGSLPPSANSAETKFMGARD